MKNYDDVYYLVFEIETEETLYLEAFQKSEDRDPGHVFLTLGQEPLFFSNSYKDEDLAAGVSKPLLKSHMNINDLIVEDSIREKLKSYDMAGVQMYPSVIVDDKGVFHENYWYINIYGRLNALDFDKCRIRRYSPSDTHHKVKEYALSSQALDEIPESQRLIFKPEKTDTGYVFVHEKIVKIFRDEGVKNLQFIKVSEYKSGMEFTSL